MFAKQKRPLNVNGGVFYVFLCISKNYYEREIN